MVKKVTRWWPVLGLIVIASAVLFAWVGCSTVEPMGPDDDPPTGMVITNPLDGASLNTEVVNIRGHAEVGATLRAYVNGVLVGSALSWPAGDEDPAAPPSFGNFTIDDVELGGEGRKRLGVLASDLYGNQAADTVMITVTVDTTRPPLTVENVIDADWKEAEQYWETNKPSVTIVGRSDKSIAASVTETDTTYVGIRVILENAEYEPDATEVYSAGGSDSVRFWASIPTPPLMWPDPDTLATYLVQAYDAAGNVATSPTRIYWNVTGRDTVLRWDDGDYGSIGNKIEGSTGQRLAVKFRAPAWASYVTQIHYFIMNDDVPGDPNPNDPTTAPFTAYVWKLDPMTEQPGSPGNSGMNSGGFYPEVEWLELTLPNAVNISDPEDYPSKQFYVGIEWLERFNPVIGEDSSDPIDFRSWFFSDPEAGWSLRNKDTMIRAVVSDVPISAGGGRTAIVYPDRTAR